jgi:hypothetical protein
LPGLKKHHSDIRFSGNKVTPDEIDRYEKTYILYPSASATWFGTIAAGSASASGSFTLTNQQADYPRTALLTITCANGTVTSGTVALTGTNQFGKALTENISCVGTSGVTTAGTGIFKTITAATLAYGITQGTALSTATLGVAIGTAAGQVARFGLGHKIGGTTNVKSITWINNGTATAITGGTVAQSLVNATSHSFAGTKIVAATDIYVVETVPTYNAENEVNVAA